MVKFSVWVIYAKRMFLCREIIAEYQIKLIIGASSSCDRCDRIVWFTVCLSIDDCILIGVSSPCNKDLVCQFNQTLLIAACDTNHGHRPLYDAGLHIFESCESNLFLDRCLFHCECIMSALEMIMTQNRSTDDRKIRIGAYKVVRKLGHKIKKLSKCCTLDLHRCVLTVKNDTMLIVIYIR